MTPAQQAPAPAAELPLPAEMQAFIDDGHDPELDHWMPWEVAEYAASLPKAEAQGGLR